VGQKYPVEPPKVRFISRVNMAYVNQSTGVVENQLPALSGWNRNQSIESVLVGIRNCMSLPQNRKLPQPPDGSEY